VKEKTATRDLFKHSLEIRIDVPEGNLQRLILRTEDKDRDLKTRQGLEVTSTRQQKIPRLGFPLGLQNRDLQLIFASNLMGSFGDGVYAYLLPVYIAETLKASSAQVGILYAVVGLLAASTLLLSGMFADRFDRKKTMIAGWIAWVPAPLCFALAGKWYEMLPGMILWGVWLGGPTMTAYIVAAADKNRLTSTFTTISAGWSLGYIFSPALGGYLATTVGMQVVFSLASISYAFAGLILLFISGQAPNSRQRCSERNYSPLQLLRTRELLVLSIFFASIMFTLMLFRPFISKFLADVYGYSKFEIGISGSVLFFGSATLGILLGKLGDRRKKSNAIACALILCSLSLTLLLIFGDFHLLIITAFLAGCSYTLWSLMNAVVGSLAPESTRARWISIPQTFSMFSSFVAPYMGGILYDVSPYYPFMIAIVIMLVLALLTSTRIFEEKSN